MNRLEAIALQRADEQMANPKSYKAREGKRRGPIACCPLCGEKLGGKIVRMQDRRVHERCVPEPALREEIGNYKEKVDGYDLDD